MIYLNHAGTSWPKPEAVHEAVRRTLQAAPHETASLLEETRQETAAFLGIGDPSRLAFTSGCTAALHLILHDLPWKPGDVVLTSSLEHHALAAPILKLKGVNLQKAPYSPGNPLPLEAAEAALRSGKVRLLAFTMASNVTGEVLPAKELAALAHKYDARCLIDAAQTAGVLPVNTADLRADYLVFAGHKGPFAPQGIGALYVAPTAGHVPDFCDVGSANVSALAGLRAGLQWVRERNVTSHVRSLASRFRSALEDDSRITLYGTRVAERRTGAVSMTIRGKKPIDVERQLREASAIAVRGGTHCAPMAHETLGTLDVGGTVRVSFGAMNSESDVNEVVKALKDLG